MSVEVTKGAIGFQIVIDCVSDITSAPVAEIDYVKPDKTDGTWTATIGTAPLTITQYEDGTPKTYELEANTYIYYTTLEDDLDVVGSWKVQSYLELTGGYKGSGTDSWDKIMGYIRG